MVGQIDRTSRARRTNELCTEHQTGARERGVGSGTQTHTAQVHRLWTASGVISDYQGGRAGKCLTAVKVTLIVQLAPAARLDPHVVPVCLNSPAVAAVGAMAMLLITMSTVAVLVGVSVCALLVPPMI